jgi:NADPH-dependent curcumin reductase CurA
MTTATANRQLRLRQRPDGRIDERTFEAVEGAVPEIGPGQALVRNLYLSVDPTNRAWIGEEPTYLPPVGIGEVMRSVGLGRVMSSNSDDYPEGALVTGLVGWQEYTTAGGEGIPLTVVPELELPLECMLGALGLTGVTAWFGIEDIGRPQEGETMVVSAAAGAVGSVAGQLAKLRGARVVGIAGGAQKCSWLVDELGFDATIDRHDPDWRAKLREACPDGVDVDFENVGGEIMDAVFGMLNLNARVALCGLISEYNEDSQPGPSLRRVLVNRVRIQGFIILDWFDRFPAAITNLGALVAAGKLKDRHTVVDGLERAPDALNMLFDGDNVGKLIVKLEE